MGCWSGGNHVRIRSATTTQGTSQTGYHHITATVNKINATQSIVKIYKNGTLIGENTIDSVMGNTQGKPWVLGQEWDGGTLSDFFQGAMD